VSSLAALSLIFSSSIGFERLMKFLWDGAKAEAGLGLECSDKNARAIIPTAVVHDVPVTGTLIIGTLRAVVAMWPSVHFPYRYIFDFSNRRLEDFLFSR